MGTWQPPIPAGAFWTEDALKIGPALSLLGYCYDKVDRHGHVALNLHEAASDMGIQYPTIKRWWNLLKHTNYIAKYHERGRAGMDVWMSKNWLDWRYAIGTETGSKMIPILQCIRYSYLQIKQSLMGGVRIRIGLDAPTPQRSPYCLIFSQRRPSAKRSRTISAQLTI